MRMTEGQTMWVAGIIEGEGHIEMTGSGGPKLAPRITVAMSDEDVIKRLHEWTGVGTVTSRKRAEDRKQMYAWRLMRQRDFLQVAYAILPHLLGRRATRLQEVVDALILHRADVLERDAQRNEICVRGHIQEEFGGRSLAGCRECGRENTRAYAARQKEKSQ